MLVTRIITASVLLLLTGTLVVIDYPLILKSFIFFIHLIILWEWLGLLKKNFFQKSLPLSIFFLCSIVIHEQNNFGLFVNFVLIASIIFWVLFVPFFLWRKKTFNGVSAFYISVLVVLSSFSASLWALNNGFFYILSILLIVWIADSSAYLVGRFFGKNKLAPNISPKKTWEGVCGAITANIVFAWFGIEFEFGCFNEIKQLTNIFYMFFLVVLITIISVLGDLFQSLLKREAKVKDSGNLLPGHGGFFDRFDAVIAVCPFMMFSVKLIQ